MLDGIKLNTTGTLATGALGGLGGFIYDRYIKGRKDIKKNLLTGLLTGGGSALAYAAYTVGSDIIKKRKGLPTSDEERSKKSELKDSALLRAGGYGGVAGISGSLGGIFGIPIPGLKGKLGYLNANKIIAATQEANAKAADAANAALAEYVKDKINPETLSGLAHSHLANTNANRVTVQELTDMATQHAQNIVDSAAADGFLPTAARGGRARIVVGGPVQRPASDDIIVAGNTTGRGARTQPYSLDVSAPGNVPGTKTINPRWTRVWRTAVPAIVMGAVGQLGSSMLRNPEARDALMRGNVAAAWKNTDLSLW